MVPKPLSPEDRKALFDAMTNWYFEGGQGMLLGEAARDVYLRAKANLTCADADLVPISLAAEVAAGRVDRSTLSKQQLSFLRTALRADMRIFAEPYGPPAQALEGDTRARGRAFLEECNIDVARRPWRDAFR
jgi:O-glycosyl hydrolase